MFGNIILAVTVVVLLVCWFVRRQYSYFRDRNTLYLKPRFPFGSIGQCSTILEMNKWIYDSYMQFRGRAQLFGIFFLTAPQVVVTDLDLVQDILIRDADKFPNHSMYLNESMDPLSAHLYSLSGERWRNMRTKLSPSFSLANTRDTFGTVHAVCFDLLQYVDRRQQRQQRVYHDDDLAMSVVNVTDMSKLFFCDAIGSAAFGMACHALSDEDTVFLQIANEYFDPSPFRMTILLFLIAYTKLANMIPMRLDSRKVTKHFSDIINETVSYRETNNIERNDFLDILLRIKRNGGLLQDDESGEVIGRISDMEIHAQSFLMFFYGFFSCHVTLAYAMFELAANQAIQDRLREEIAQVLNGEEETYDKIEEMTYLHQIVDETLRKYSASVYLERISDTDYVTRYAGYTIEKGVSVIIPTTGIHLDPDIYPDPNRFDPDRMTADKIKSRHPMSFLPFGAGPRICIGPRISYLQIKLALVALIGNYRFTVNGRTKQPLTEPSVEILRKHEDIWLDALPV